jgi:thiol:disulfide interchange protein DsbD
MKSDAFVLSVSTMLLFSNTALAQQQDPVKVEIRVVEDMPLRTGSQATVEIVAKISRMPDAMGKHWHIYPRKEDHRGIEKPTSVKVTQLSAGFEAGDIKWPPTSMSLNAFNEPQPVYEGTAVFQLPITIMDAAQDGSHTIELEFRYQACASLCIRPAVERLSLTLTVDSDGPGTDVTGSAATTAEPADGDGDLTTSTLPSSQSTRDPSADSKQDDFRTNVFGREFGFSAGNPFAIPLLLLFAGIGGFLLNLTPCVLPIIPIKIIGLTQSAQGNTARTRLLGVAMGIGILTFWIAIGAAISFVSGFDSISSLFQRPAFGICIGLFIAVMGIGMMTDYAIQLPQTVHRINPSHDNLHGAFLFGVMTAVLSTPCTAPFMGSTAAWATRASNPTLVLAVFAAIAIGMGWPYVLLAWYPKLVSRVPRTGPASVLVKQAMGLLMLAVASFFGGTGLLGLVKEHPHLGPVLHWWFVTFFVALTAFWLIWKSLRIMRGVFGRVAVSLLGLTLLTGMTYWAIDETSDSRVAFQSEEYWQPYDPEILAEAKADGQVAIVHFTADW